LRVGFGHELARLSVTVARTPESALAPEGIRTLVEVDPVADPRWDELVARHPDADVYHLGAWAQVLKRAYGDRPAYLAIEAEDGSLAGGLPLVLTSGLVTRRRMRSLPVFPPAGPLADSDEDLRMLIDGACRSTDAQRARVWTLHTRRGELEAAAPQLRWVPKHPTYILALDGDPDEMRRGWKKSARNLWRSVKKAEQAGVTVRVGSSKADLDAFYGLYARTMRRRRVLPRPYRQLSAARDLLPEGVFRLYLAEHDGEVVAGLVGHSFGEMHELLYLGSDERQFDLRPNHALYWHALKWAAETGHTQLDFGHANPKSALADFKLQWGAEPVQEYRYDYVPGADAGPSGPRLANAAEGRESTSLLARGIERAPVPLLRAAARVVYRRL
jgi:CelD/BcsL family acetyltransferase involved in cellulose biosynthesis